MPPDLLVLADDLTGALEVGAKLGRQVGFSLPASIIDTETRHVTPQAAQAKIHAILAEAGYPRHVYKKTDSTLRGNIAAELAALSAAYPNEPIDYIPAYPKMGRTVKGGRLYVHGVLAGEINLPNVVIHDGETDEEVADAVRAAGRILCGPASVADYLAPSIPLPSLPRIQTCMVVNGSQQEISALQIADAAAAAWRIVDTSEVERAIEESPWLILRLEHARATALTVCDIVKQAKPDALAVFGGDTAYAIVHALGEQTISPIAEVVSGVPISRLTNIYLITKAGGFGSTDLLTCVRNKLCWRE